MSDRNIEYVLVRERKPKQSQKYYYSKDTNDNDNDDDDDDDNDSQTSTRYLRVKPHERQRIKYISSDPTVRVRKKSYGDQVILDDDDNTIKVVRRRHRTPTPPPPIEHRRMKQRPRESQSVFYETPSGHLVSRSLKKNIVQTKKTQVVYADDEPTRIIKKVIIDPRTGERETFFKKDKPTKQRKYYLQQHPAEILVDSDDEEEDDGDHHHHHAHTQYVKLVKHRTIAAEELPKRESSPKYIMVKKKVASEPIYALTSKMPAIKTDRRIIYELPAKKPLTKYVYSSNGKYYK